MSSALALAPRRHYGRQVRLRTVVGIVTSSCAALLLATTPAHAASSSATTLANAVTSAGVSLGSTMLTTSYTASLVTARVSSLGLRLPAGRQYRAIVCLNVHVLTAPPDGQCVTRDIDA